MATTTLTGQDTHIINGRVLTDLAVGTVVEITYNDDLTVSQVGKNKNAIISAKEDGIMGTIVYRIIRNSADDKFLNSLLIQQHQDLPSFTTMDGSSSTRTGDSAGNVSIDTYNGKGGAFKKHVGKIDTSDGNVDQAISEYTIEYVTLTRTIG